MPRDEQLLPWNFAPTASENAHDSRTCCYSNSLGSGSRCGDFDCRDMGREDSFAEIAQRDHIKAVGSSFLGSPKKPERPLIKPGTKALAGELVLRDRRP